MLAPDTWKWGKTGLKKAVGENNLKIFIFFIY